MRRFEDTLMENLKDPQFASGFLDEAVEHGDPVYFRKALGQIIKAQGGISKAAREMKVNRANLSESLSDVGNPSFNSMFDLITHSGFRMKFTPAQGTGSLKRKRIARRKPKRESVRG